MKIKQSNHRGKRTKVVCSNCGEEYLELKTRIKEGRGKFCSNECYQEYRKKNSKDSKEANRLYQKKNKYGLLKEEYYNLFIRQDNKCAICGKELTYNQKNYCSQFCAHSHISKTPTKEQLIDKLNEFRWNKTKTGKYFSVSDSAINKWIKKYGIIR